MATALLSAVPVSVAGGGYMYYVPGGRVEQYAPERYQSGSQDGPSDYFTAGPPVDAIVAKVAVLIALVSRRKPPQKTLSSRAAVGPPSPTPQPPTPLCPHCTAHAPPSRRDPVNSNTDVPASAIPFHTPRKRARLFVFFPNTLPLLTNRTPRAPLPPQAAVLVVASCILNCCLCKDFSAVEEELAAREIDHQVDTADEVAKFKGDLSDGGNTDLRATFEGNVSRVHRRGRECCCCGCRDHNRCLPPPLSDRQRRMCLYLYTVFAVVLGVMAVLMVGLDDRVGSALQRTPEVAGRVSVFLGTTLVGELTPLVAALGIVLGDLNSTLLQASNCFSVDALISSAEYTSAASFVGVVEANTAAVATMLDAGQSMVTGTITTQSAVIRETLNATATDIVGELKSLAKSMGDARDDLDERAGEIGDAIRLALGLLFGLVFTAGLAALCVGWADGLYGETRARYRLNAGTSFAVIGLAALSLALAAAVLAAVITTASFCNDHTLIIADIARLYSPDAVTDSAIYYIECPTYSDARLRSDFPFDNARGAVMAAMGTAEEAVAALEAVLSPCSGSGATALRSSMDTARGLLGGDDAGLLGGDAAGLLAYNGVLKCSGVAGVLNAVVEVVCKDGYVAMALLFELLLCAGLALLATEVMQKCMRRSHHDTKDGIVSVFVHSIADTVEGGLDAVTPGRRSSPHPPSAVATKRNQVAPVDAPQDAPAAGD